LKKREETFRRAMLHSQKVLESMKENAEKQAELIIAEAEIKADKIIHHAQNRLNHLQEDITELRRQRVQIEVEINAIIDAHAKLLKISQESMRTADADNAKVAILSSNAP
jgi:cell division initiation protein